MLTITGITALQNELKQNRLKCLPGGYIISMLFQQIPQKKLEINYDFKTYKNHIYTSNDKIL
jgi:hypothetical protein